MVLFCFTLITLFCQIYNYVILLQLHDIIFIIYIKRLLIKQTLAQKESEYRRIKQIKWLFDRNVLSEIKQSTNDRIVKLKKESKFIMFVSSSFNSVFINLCDSLFLH